MGRMQIFGYKMIDARIQINQTESEIIKGIFGLYIQGNSLQKIAERLNHSNVRYNEAGKPWNKNLIKRIIENPRYTGTDEYPEIVPKTIAEEALRCKDVRAPKTDAGYMEKLRRYRQKNKCSLCGSCMSRVRGGARSTKSYWKCNNPKCTARDQKFSEELLDNMLIHTINNLISNLELIDYQDNSAYEKDTEIIKASNRISEMIADTDIETETITNEILELASLKFKKCKAGDSSKVTQRMRETLAVRAKIETVEVDILDNLIKTIRIHPNRTVNLELLNGKNIEGKESIYEGSVSSHRTITGNGDNVYSCNFGRTG